MATLRLLPADVELETHEGEAILTTIVRDGFKYRIGCRRGGCGICKADILSGEVSYPTTVADSVLTPAERGAGVALTCRAVPTTDVVVRFSEESRLRLVVPLAFGIAVAELTGKTRARTETPDRERERHAG
jgi:ferredoxin